jgi:hypothetical protein
MGLEKLLRACRKIAFIIKSVQATEFLRCSEETTI